MDVVHIRQKFTKFTSLTASNTTDYQPETHERDIPDSIYVIDYPVRQLRTGYYWQNLILQMYNETLMKRMSLTIRCYYQSSNCERDITDSIDELSLIINLMKFKVYKRDIKSQLMQRWE